MDSSSDSMREFSKRLTLSCLVALPFIVFQIFGLQCLKSKDYSVKTFLWGEYLTLLLYLIILLNIIVNVNWDKFMFLFLVSTMAHTEGLIYWKKLTEAYVSFLIMNITIIGMAIYMYKKKYWLIIIELASNIYVIVSAFVHFSLNKEYPAHVFMSCYFVYIAILFPMYYLYTNLQGYMRMQENLILDFKAILESLPYGIAILTTEDCQPDVYAANSSLIQFFGSTTEFLLFIRSNQFPLIATNTRLEYQSKIASITVTKSHFYLFKKDGYIFTLHDTTEITHKEEKMARENMKWLFVNTANHQLRTPLSAIASLISLVVPEIQEERPKKHLLVASLAVTNLRHIIDDTIMLSDCESSQIKITPIKFVLRELCNDIIQLFLFEANKADLSLSVQCLNDDDQQEVYGDKSKLLHIVYTLISNAIKYTPSGYVKVLIELDHSLVDDVLRVHVEDSGIGMDDDVKVNMFEIFANEKESKKALKVSSGLGLHVANLIAKSMGGSITFSSVKQKGTIAIVAVKVEMVNFHNAHEKSISASQTALAEQCKIDKASDKVLVVDDNMSNVYVLKKMLKSIGVDSDEAHNGAEAVDKFRKKPYKLIFMDVNMPVMNGLDASSQISKEKIPTMIIALTAQDEMGETDYKLYGIHKWIVKPISLNAIKEIIGQAK